MTVVMFGALGAALFGAAGASAAPTIYGRECLPSIAYIGSHTLFEELLGKGVPVSGVITSWKMSAPGESPELTQRLKVVEFDAKTGEPMVVGESAVVPVLTADQGVPTRIPVKEGDMIGLSSQGESGAALGCQGRSPEDLRFYAIAPGDIPIGGNAIGGGMPDTALPVQVTIEPDADGDGFGDETQDACPTSALLQTACPTIAPPTPPASPSPAPPPTPRPLALAAVHKGSATVKVTSDVAASVAVTSRVGLGGGASATPSGGVKTIAAGGTASFTLKFPKALKARLAALPAKRKLTLRATVTATSPAGPVGTASLSLKLHGQG
jgi:hypothetical protein